MSKRERPSDRQRLLKLQKRIFHLLKAEADSLMGETPEPIRRYERTFQRDFSRLTQGRVSHVTKAELIQAIRGAEVTFISDFHAFRQAQRTVIRVLRSTIKPGERWLMGLEMIPSHMQDALDAFQEGRLSLEKFHQLIRYRENWGFPWENYAPIFDWARENQIRLIALNKPRELLLAPDDSGLARTWIADESELHLRDQWAAGIITDLFASPGESRSSPETSARRSRLKMIVLYGELHLATRHLPYQLTRLSKKFLGTSLRSLILHQNHDGLYWKLAKSHRQFHAEIFKLKKNAFCVFSGTPWTKLQSLISWAEGAPDAHASENSPNSQGRTQDYFPASAKSGSNSAAVYEEDLDSAEEDEGLVESEMDYLSLMRQYSDTIAEFIEIPAPSYESMEVITIDDADLLDSTLATSSLSRAESSLVKFLVRTNHRVLIPGADVAYLSLPSHNSTAELAAVRLYRRSTRTDSIAIRDREDFFRLILEAAFGFFGSLIINPRRKCEEPGDHRKRLMVIDSTSTSSPAELYPFEKESRLLALSFLENRRPWQTPTQSKRKPSAQLRLLEALLAEKRLNPGILLGARLIGLSLGKRIHHAVIAGTATTSLLRKMAAPYIRRNGSETPLISFEERYLEALRMTSHTKASHTPSENL